MSGQYPNEPIYESEPDAADWVQLGDEDQVRAVADYLADMIGQLDMARRSRLDLLVYLLSMAKSEAQASARNGVISRPDA